MNESDESANMGEFIIEIEEEYSSAEEDNASADEDQRISAKEILSAVQKLGIKSKVTIIESRTKRKDGSEQQNDTGYEDQSSEEEVVGNETPASNISWSEVVTSPSRPPFSLSPFLYDEDPEDKGVSQQLACTSDNSKFGPPSSNCVPPQSQSDRETTSPAVLNVPMHRRNLPSSFWMEPCSRMDTSSAFSCRKSFAPCHINPHPPFNRLFRAPVFQPLATDSRLTQRLKASPYLHNYVDLYPNPGSTSQQSQRNEGLPFSFNNASHECCPSLPYFEQRAAHKVPEGRHNLPQQDIKFGTIPMNTIQPGNSNIMQPTAMRLLPNTVPPYLLKY